MDPRPYNYEFRRPRPNNLTYQSYNAYESLYHMGKLQSQYPNSLMRDEYAQKMSLYSPDYASIYTGGQQELPKRYEDKSINTDRSRRGSDYSQRSQSSLASEVSQPTQPSQPQRRASVLSNYGSNSLQKSASQNQTSQINKVMVRNDTSQIYKKQQRPFDIINLYARGPDPLRVYPKLTQQNIMLQRGIVQNQ